MMARISFEDGTLGVFNIQPDDTPLTKGARYPVQFGANDQRLGTIEAVGGVMALSGQVTVFECQFETEESLIRVTRVVG